MTDILDDNLTDVAASLRRLDEAAKAASILVARLVGRGPAAEEGEEEGSNSQDDH